MSRLLFALAVCAARAAAGPLTAQVNPLWASRGGAGFGGWGCEARNPGAMAPTPLLRLGPDTTRVDPVLGEAWSKLNRHSGYFGSDNSLRAFSLTHVQGAGDADLGTVGVSVARLSAAGVAAAAAVRPVAAPPLTFDRSPFRVPYAPANAVAAPGRFAVDLPSIFARVVLTASGPRAGVIDASCGAGVAPGSGGAPVRGPCAFVVDACHRAHDQTCGLGSGVTLRAATAADGAGGGAAYVVEGVHVDHGEFVRFNYTGVNIFFHMVVFAVDSNGTALAATDAGTWANYTAAIAPSLPVSAAVGPDADSLGAYLVFPPPPTDGASVRVTARVGVSAVSLAAAAANLAAEQMVPPSSGTFASVDAVYAATDAAWEALLGSVSITLPADAGEASDAAALAARAHAPVVDHAGSAPYTIAAAARAALAAYLDTPNGRAVALQHGWSRPDAAFAGALAAARAARDAAAAAPAEAAESAASAAIAAADALARLQLPAADVERAAAELARAAALSRAAAAARTSSSADASVLYTLLYLTFCAPTTYSDADGRYLGFDFAVHAADLPGSSFLSDLSLWDTYRSQAGLLALAAPRVLADAVGSLVAMAKQGPAACQDAHPCGMPRWPFANLYTEDMVGHHGTLELTDCVLVTRACDGRVSVADAAAAVLAQAAAQDASQPQYVALGYVPLGVGSASETLEWALDDYASALWAAAAGNATLAATLAARAQSFRNVFDAAIPAVAPRNGTTGEFFNGTGIWAPHPFNAYYTEGNAAHWTWSAPHNMSGLVNLFTGGAAEFAAVLEVVLANQTFWDDDLSTFLPNPFAWLGNEPSMLLPWSHAWAGAGYASYAQFWPRWHLRRYYSPSADMVPGNDDYGTLSAWGVWAHLGLYPVAPTGSFVLGSPVVASATVAAPPGYGRFSGAPGPTLRVVANNASAASVYVARARANGAPLPQPLVTWAQLWPTGDGVALLEFDMTDSPVPWSV